MIETENKPALNSESSRPFEAKRTIGKTEITFFGIEHWPGEFSKAPWPLVENEIRGADGIVMEFGLMELETTAFADKTWGSLARADAGRTGIIQFFGRIAELAAANGKNIILFDPANNPAFMIYNNLLPALMMPIWPLEQNLEALMAKRVAQRKQVGRRLFLKWLGLGTGVATLSGFFLSGGMLQEVPILDKFPPLWRECSINQKDLRWVTIAQGLVQYAREHDGEKLWLVYPPRHIIDGILFYLDHPRQRELKYKNIYSKARGVDKNIRQYNFKDGEWALVNRTPII